MMSSTNPPPALPVDEDIQRTVANVLQTYVILFQEKEQAKAGRRAGGHHGRHVHHRCDGEQGGRQGESEAATQLKLAVCQALQEERMGWTQKLHATLQELNRQCKERMSVHIRLQSLADSLDMTAVGEGWPRSASPPRAQAQAQQDDSGGGQGSEDLIRRLCSHVQDLQDAARGVRWDQDLQWSLECLQRNLARSQEEKEEREVLLQQKAAELQWLQKEMATLQQQLLRLQEVVLNYNTAHSTPFRLDTIHHPPCQPPHHSPCQPPHHPPCQPPHHPPCQPPHHHPKKMTDHRRDLVKRDRSRLSVKVLDACRRPHAVSKDHQDAGHLVIHGTDHTKSSQDNAQSYSKKAHVDDDERFQSVDVPNAIHGEPVDDGPVHHHAKQVKFHTDDTHTTVPPKQHGGDPDPGKVVVCRRTYVEGERTEDFVTSAEELAVWKQRVKHKVVDVRGRGPGANAGISQCLRCQQLFKAKENNPRACHYHHKGREIRELYDMTGRLSKVLYKWACCKRGLDIHGCAYGYHI